MRQEREQAHREAQRLEAERLAIEETARIEIERQAIEQQAGPAFLTDSGELRIPRCSLFKYRWWRPEGQSLFVTIAELNAPLETWRRYATQNPDLITEKHRSWCVGNVQKGHNFSFCTQCGYYCE